MVIKKIVEKKRVIELRKQEDSIEEREKEI